VYAWVHQQLGSLHAARAGVMHSCWRAGCCASCRQRGAWHCSHLLLLLLLLPLPLQDCVRLPHLVVVPLTTLSNWERELATWAPYLRVVSLHGSAASRQLLLDHAMFTPHEPGSGRGRAAWQVCSWCAVTVQLTHCCTDMVVCTCDSKACWVIDTRWLAG
jgi:hypothetical protein